MSADTVIPSLIEPVTRQSWMAHGQSPRFWPKAFVVQLLMLVVANALHEVGAISVTDHRKLAARRTLLSSGYAAAIAMAVLSSSLNVIFVVWLSAELQQATDRRDQAAGSRLHSLQ